MEAYEAFESVQCLNRDGEGFVNCLFGVLVIRHHVLIVSFFVHFDDVNTVKAQAFFSPLGDDFSDDQWAAFFTTKVWD